VFVRRNVAEAILALYDDLSMTPADGPGAWRALSDARKHGWAPPLAWDDIDDPNETPDTGEVKYDKSGRPVQRDRIVENAQWLADADENLTAVCDRLDITPENLYQACRRSDRLDLYATLSRRDISGEMAATLRAIKKGAA
jgi:hypothetical protein